MSIERQSSLRKNLRKKRTNASKAGDEDGEDSSQVKVRAAGIDPGVQSSLFNDIREIPTGSYMPTNQSKNETAELS